MDDLHLLPRLSDRTSYLYVEHARIDRELKAVAFHQKVGGQHTVTQVPVASLALLILGPGTEITHAAIQTLAENNCLVAWCGEEGVRLYAHSTGGTRSARHLLHQIRVFADEEERLAVVHRMYRHRFRPGALPPTLSLQQLRGMEGIRIREAYSKASEVTGVPWQGRSYRRDNWRDSDPVNRALSCANSCLYGICHAAILSAGYSAALGFIHTGKQLSFVYDIADLYKVNLTIPVAFRAVAEHATELERTVRLRLRDAFRESRLLESVIGDIRVVLGESDAAEPDFDGEQALPGGLWQPGGVVEGGLNHADGLETGHDDPHS